jgi:carboxymethylenebutenolidase
VQHLAGKATSKLERTNNLIVYDYAGVTTSSFALPFQAHFDYSAEAVSHTRNLSFLKQHMHGPYFDLEAIWDDHTYFEFSDRSVEHTMSSMVQEPYVNHIPTVSSENGTTHTSRQILRLTLI